MAKFMEAADFPPAGVEDQDMEWAQTLLRNIINVQNFQVQALQGWLDANAELAGDSEHCYDLCAQACERRRRLLFASDASAMPDGCPPCA